MMLNKSTFRNKETIQFKQIIMKEKNEELLKKVIESKKVNTDILFTTKEEYKDRLMRENITIKDYLNYFSKYKKYALEFDEYTDEEIFDYLLDDIVKYRLFEDDYEYIDDDLMYKIKK